MQADGEADVCDRAVGGAQQGGGALEAPGEQVRVRRLAEGAAELAAEVCAREAGGAGEVVDAERLGVPGVGQVLGAQQVADGGTKSMRSVSVRPRACLESHRRRPIAGPRGDQ